MRIPVISDMEDKIKALFRHVDVQRNDLKRIQYRADGLSVHLEGLGDDLEATNFVVCEVHAAKFDSHGKTLYKLKKGIGDLFKKIRPLEERTTQHVVQLASLQDSIRKLTDRVDRLEGKPDLTGMFHDVDKSPASE